MELVSPENSPPRKSKRAGSKPSKTKKVKKKHSQNGLFATKAKSTKTKKTHFHLKNDPGVPPGEKGGRKWHKQQQVMRVLSAPKKQLSARDGDDTQSTANAGERVRMRRGKCEDKCV